MSRGREEDVEAKGGEGLGDGADAPSAYRPNCTRAFKILNSDLALPSSTTSPTMSGGINAGDDVRTSEYVQRLQRLNLRAVLR